MASYDQEDVMAAQVVDGLSETSHNGPHTTRPESQQEREQALNHNSHNNKTPEVQPESESGRRVTEASPGEVPTGKSKPPPPDALPLTVAPSHVEAMGNAYGADARENQVSVESIDWPESPEFEFQDAYVTFDVCLL